VFGRQPERDAQAREVEILAGPDQYFALRLVGAVVARIVNHVESYDANF
jgi:hypothetical protein